MGDKRYYGETPMRLWRDSGAARGTVGCRVGAIGARGSAVRGARQQSSGKSGRNKLALQGCVSYECSLSRRSVVPIEKLFCGGEILARTPLSSDSWSPVRPIWCWLITEGLKARSGKTLWKTFGGSSPLQQGELDS